MTFEKKAELFVHALQFTDNVAAALEEVERAERAEARRSRSRLSDDQIAQIRGRRMRGEKLAALAADYGVSEPFICRICTGIVVQTGRAVPVVAKQVFAMVGEELSIADGWNLFTRHGRPTAKLTIAFRAVALVLRDVGCSREQIADALSMRTERVCLVRAERDARANYIADQVKKRLRAEIAADLAGPPAAEAPPAHHAAA